MTQILRFLRLDWLQLNLYLMNWSQFEDVKLEQSLRNLRKKLNRNTPQTNDEGAKNPLHN